MVLKFPDFLLDRTNVKAAEAELGRFATACYTCQLMSTAPTAPITNFSKLPKSKQVRRGDARRSSEHLLSLLPDMHIMT